MISGDIKAIYIIKPLRNKRHSIVAVAYKFLYEIPSKLEIQCK